MTRPLLAIACGALLLGAGSCAHRAPATRLRPAHVFVVPADSLAPRYARIAIVPVRSQGSLVVPVLEAPLEARIAAVWTQAGYQVVGAGQGERLWISATRRVGGLFDRRTGRVIPARREAAWQRLLATYRNVYGADLVLRYEVAERRALLQHGVLAWDDSERKLDESNWITRRFMYEPWGEAPATSLVATLLDTDGRVLFTSCAGIAPMLQKTAEDWRLVGYEEALADSLAGASAIDRAFGPWLQKVPPALAGR